MLAALELYSQQQGLLESGREQDPDISAADDDLGAVDALLLLLDACFADDEACLALRYSVLTTVFAAPLGIGRIVSFLTLPPPSFRLPVA